MGSVRQHRRRLPRRVYWVRRGIVVGLALLLVFGLGKLFGGTGTDATSAGAAAQTGPATRAPSAGPVGPQAPTKKLRSKAKVPLVPPSGPCLDDDVSVLPSVKRAWAGAPITITLALTGTQPACTFDVSAQSLVAKIVSGSDRIWSSQDCPKSIATTQVVVRSSQPIEVPVTWNGRRSDEKCTNTPDWALAGFYHVYAAALGSSPSDLQFEVTVGPAVRVTRTPKPRASASPSRAPGAPAETPSAGPRKRN